MSSGAQVPADKKLCQSTDDGVVCVYLSSWDHVMGPQLVFYWRMESKLVEFTVADEDSGSTAGPTRSTRRYLKCHQLLENAEAFLLHKEAPQQAGGRPSEAEVYASNVLQLLHGGLEQRHTRSCMLVLPEKKVALHAVIFSLAGSPVSITAVFHLAGLKDLWLLLSLTDLSLARVALVCRTPDREFVRKLNTATALLQRYFLLASSLLRTRTLDKRAAVDALSGNFLPGDLTCRSLQSHLQTRNCSIILGDSTSQVKPVLRILTSLLDHKELMMSLWDGSTREGVTPCYAPGLQLQGLVRGSLLGGPGPLSARELLWSPHPSTVVDVSQGRVWQCPLHVGFKGPLTRKLRAARMPSPESHVSMFVSNISRLAGTAAADQLLQAFKRHLLVKALALIQCTSRSKKALSTRYLQSVLAIPYLSDFEVILAHAEKLRPGLSHYVLAPA